MEQTGAVIIAAGLSSRMGKFKPMLPINRTTFIQQIIDRIMEAGVTTIVIITGYHADELEAHLQQSGAILVRNERYAKTQMLDSICIGLRFLQEKCSKILVTPADIPLVSVETYRKILEQEADFVRPVYHGCYGHPVLINHNMVAAILEYKGSLGLRGAMDASGGFICCLPVEDPTIHMDADTPEDYSKLLKYSEEQSSKVSAILKMRRHILLTGPIGCGKSTLLQDTLGGKLKTAGGFCTTRLFDQQGSLQGFRHLPPYELVSLTESFQHGKEGIFLTYTQEEMIQKDEVLLEYTIPLIQDGARHPMIVMDEIGGCELLLPEFRKAIYEVFEQEVPCIGVLKNEQSSKSLMEHLCLPNAYRKVYTEFVDSISKNSRVSIIPCTRDTIDIAKESILMWMAEQGG